MLKLVNGKADGREFLIAFHSFVQLIIFADVAEGAMLEGNGARAEAESRRREGKRSRRRRTAPARRPTMIDVANEARVSQTTVSLVLNHADGARLSTETRQRVMKAAARLGYQPVRRGRRAGRLGADFDRLRLRRDLDRSLDRDRARRRARKGLGARADGHGDGDARRRRHGGCGARAARLPAAPRPHLRDHQHAPRRSARRAHALAGGAPQLPRGRPSL